MKIHITNRATIELPNTCVKNHVIISISTPYDIIPKISQNNNTIGILNLVFDDSDHKILDFKEQVGRDQVLFTDEMAFCIFNFIERMKERIEIIIVHCDAGISRSSAVAAGLALYYNKDDKWIFNSKLYYPNRFVYSKMLKQIETRME